MKAQAQIKVEGEAAAPALSYRGLTNSWIELCERFLPVIQEGVPWRYSRASTARDPEQGWKLHISATVLTAVEVMRRVAPFLRRRGVLFKASSSLEELNRLNSGLYYGYSQIGKFITVYSRTDAEAVDLARRLDEATFGLAAPFVPFDCRLKPGSCVYYRYGAFTPLVMTTPEGATVPAIRNPQGGLEHDLRDRAGPPNWAADPFVSKRIFCSETLLDSPLRTTFKAFRAFSQRGKGGVYQALDLSVNPPRLCILKEGRKGGEVAWDGRDGRWRVEHEERVLRDLRAARVNVPLTLASFSVDGHYYLVTEFMGDQSLQALLSKRRRRLSVSKIIRLAKEISLIMAKIHAAGWVWRDCKPANLVISETGELRPLDFEGACRIEEPDPSGWGTAEFAPPEWLDAHNGEPRTPEDLYALGATMYLLLTGTLPRGADPIPVGKLRRRVPPAVSELISKLLNANPKRRPSACAVSRTLSAGWKSI